jgi:hypothetical protein
VRWALQDGNYYRQSAKVVKELDAFPKVLDDYKETTATGGGGNSLGFL